MNYKSRRSFINAKISYIAKKIAGEFSEVLISNEYYELHKEKSLPAEIIFPGVSKLSDTSAEMLYERLLKVQKESNKFLKTIQLPNVEKLSSIPNSFPNTLTNKEHTRQSNLIGEGQPQIKTPPSHPLPDPSPDSPCNAPHRIPMTLNQRKAIIKITKYDFKWKPEATFSFILQTEISLRYQLSKYEIQNSRLNILFNILNRNQADKIIKKLILIKKRNSQSNTKEKNL